MKLKALVIISLFILLNYSKAATITSTTTGGNWSTGSTWVGGVVPNWTNDNVVINGDVTLNSSLTIPSGKTLTINAGKTLVVNAVITNNGTITFQTGGSNKITINSGTNSTNFANNGTFNCGTGTMEIKATGGQRPVTGTIVFYNVILDNVNQMNFGSNSTVNGTIRLNNGAYITTHPTYGANSMMEVNGSYGTNLTNRYLWGSTEANTPASISFLTGTTNSFQQTFMVRKNLIVASGATVSFAKSCVTFKTTFAGITNNGTLNLGSVNIESGLTWNVDDNYTMSGLSIQNNAVVNCNSYTLTITYSTTGSCNGAYIIYTVGNGQFNAGTGTVVANTSANGNAGFNSNIVLNNFVAAGGVITTSNSTSINIIGNVTVNTGSNFNYGNNVPTGSIVYSPTATVTNNGGTTANITNTTTVPTAPVPVTVDNALTALTGTSGGGSFNNGQKLTAPNSYALTSNMTITGTRKILYIYAPAEFITNGYTITADSVYLFGKLTVSNSGGLSAFLGTTKMVIGSGSTIVYEANSGNQTVSPASYSNLQLIGDAGKTFAAGTYIVGGDFTVTGGAADISTNSTSFIFNGSNAQSIKGLPFTNVTFSGNGNKTLNGDTKVTGVVTLAGSANLVSNGALTLVSTAAGTASIGAITGTATITGNVNYERYVPAGRLWRFIGWPINGNTFANSWQNQIYITGAGSGGSLGSTNSNGFDYTSSNEAGLYYYNETVAAGINAKWATVPNTATAIDPTKGYRVFIRGARTQGTALLNGSTYTPLPVTLKGTGTINKGDYPVSLTCSNGCGTGDGWHLLSNPYPSAIDWNNANWKAARNNNIQATVYVYNPSQNKYGAWSPTGGSVNGGTSTIASGQSFYIKTNGATTLTFKEEYKVTNATVGLFGKSSGLVNNLKIQIGDNSKIYDETVVYMYPTATFGLDQDIDATKPDVANATISSYTNNNNSKLVFNAIPEINNGDSAIVLLHTPLANYTYSYNLSFQGMETFNNTSTQFLLIDNYTGSTTIISTLSPMYSFTTTAGVAASYAGSRFSIKITTASGSLPVKLISFSGVKTNKTAVLKWTTASEENNDRFEVHSSTNGIDYKTIGTVLGAGYSNRVLNYTFIDEQPATGINYYRLKQVDKDGTSSLSTIISLNFAEAVKTSISAWPIPATDYITLELNNATTTTAVLVVRDMMGKAMLTQNILADETNFNYPVAVENFKPGVYVLEVTQNDGSIETIKFVKN